MVHCALLLFSAALTRGHKQKIGEGRKKGKTAGALYSPEFNIKALFDNNLMDENTISFSTVHNGRSKFRPLIAQKRTLLHKQRKFYRPQPVIWAFIAFLLTNIFAKMPEISPN